MTKSSQSKRGQSNNVPPKKKSKNTQIWRKVAEGKIQIRVPVSNIVSKELPVFYNPVMSLQRNIAVGVLAAMKRKDLIVCDPLAGSGVRILRFLKELPRETIKQVFANDANPKWKKLFTANAKKNKISTSCVELALEDASMFMLQHGPFDYVDIDPFGSPNPFLDAAIKQLHRGGILAVTATDTAALAGSAPRACKRKYDAVPSRIFSMHETGMRILIRKIQLIGSQYDKALVPVLCHATEHYYRLYLACATSRRMIDHVLAQHGSWMQCGPLWKGQLWDKKVLADAQKTISRSEKETIQLLSLLSSEAEIAAVGFYDVHALCKQLHRQVPKFDLLLQRIRSNGFPASRTHFSMTSIRTTMPELEFIELLRNA